MLWGIPKLFAWLAPNPVRRRLARTRRYSMTRA
jgi:hypothetical protein